MVIGDKWANYREDNVGKTRHIKESVLDNVWWDKIDYILSCTSPK